MSGYSGCLVLGSMALVLAATVTVGPLCADEVIVPGTLHDQDKKHTGDGRNWTWNYYDDTGPNNGQFDLGETVVTWLSADTDNDHIEGPGEDWGTWKGATDNSCWAATASNLVRYLGGPNRYDAWMFTDGCAAKDWTNSGHIGAALTHDGYAHWDCSASAGVFSENPVTWARERFADGLPVGLAVTWAGGGGHAITVYGIDDDADTMTCGNSDSDTGGDNIYTENYAWSWADSRWSLVRGATSHQINGIRTFAAARWQGAGAGGATTEWSDAGNWDWSEHGGAPADTNDPNLLRRIESVGGGVTVDTGQSYEAAKVIVRGADSNLFIYPGGELTLWSLFVERSGSVRTGSLRVAGTLSARRADFKGAQITVDGGQFNVEFGETEGVPPNMTLAGSVNLWIGNGGGVSIDSDLLIQQSDHGNALVSISRGALPAGGTLEIDGNLVVDNGCQLGVPNADVAIDVGWHMEVRGGYVELTHADVTIGHDLRTGYDGDAEVSVRGMDLRVGGMRLGNGDGTNSVLTLQSRDGVDPALLTTGPGADLHVGSGGDEARFEHHAGRLGRASAGDGHPDLTLGSGDRTIARYTMYDGQVEVDNLNFGPDGVGIFTQDGGTVTVHGTMDMGGAATAWDSTYTLNGGTFDLAGSSVSPGLSHLRYNGGTINFTGTTYEFNIVELAHEAGSGVALDLSHLDFSARQLVVGTRGVAELSQSDCVMNADALYVAYGVDSTGSGLTINDGSPSVDESLTVAGVLSVGARSRGFFTQNSANSAVAADTIVVGDSHIGAFPSTYTQNGGTVEVADTLTLGDEASAYGRYVLDGADLATTLTTARTVVGEWGTGRFDHRGGHHTTGQLDVNCSGTLPDLGYYLSGGRLDAGATTVGIDREGFFDHSRGQHYPTTLRVGDGADGTYALSGVGLLDATDQHIGDGSTGTLRQTGGTNIVRGDQHIGCAPDSIGLYDQSDGSNTVYGELRVGCAPGSSGTYQITGDAACIIPDGASLLVGCDPAAIAMVTASGPDALIRARGNVTIGHAGPGTLKLDSGATLKVDSLVTVGSGGSGELLMAGGTVADGSVVEGVGPILSLIDVAPGSTLIGRGRVQVPLVCAGLLAPTGAGLTFSQDVNATGTTIVPGGTDLQLQAGGTFDGPVVSNGRLYATGGTMRLRGGVSGAGGIEAGGGKVEISSDVAAGSVFVDSDSVVTQNSGTTTVAGRVHVFERGGTYVLEGTASLATDRTSVYGTFDHVAGSHAANTLEIGGDGSWGYGDGDPARYQIAGGSLTVEDLFIGDGSATGPMGSPVYGVFAVSSRDVEITVTGRYVLGLNGMLDLAAGIDESIIHCTGSAFENNSRTPAAVADLDRVTLIFEGGPAVVDPFEVAGADLGPVAAGLDENFALGTLQLGGADDVGQLLLVDMVDNQLDGEGNEALYVENLVLGPGSSLDLGGLNLYYLRATIDPDATIAGGSARQIPEPTALSLLLAGGLLATVRRRR